MKPLKIDFVAAGDNMERIETMHSSKSNTGLIVGIIVGVVVILALAVVGFLLYKKKSSNSSQRAVLATSNFV